LRSESSCSFCLVVLIVGPSVGSGVGDELGPQEGATIGCGLCFNVGLYVCFVVVCLGVGLSVVVWALGQLDKVTEGENERTIMLGVAGVVDIIVLAGAGVEITTLLGAPA